MGETVGGDGGYITLENIVGGISPYQIITKNII